MTSTRAGSMQYQESGRQPDLTYLQVIYILQVCLRETWESGVYNDIALSGMLM